LPKKQGGCDTRHWWDPCWVRSPILSSDHLYSEAGGDAKKICRTAQGKLVVLSEGRLEDWHVLAEQNEGQKVCALVREKGEENAGVRGSRRGSTSRKPSPSLALASFVQPFY